MSEELFNIVKNLLQFDYKERPTIEKVLLSPLIQNQIQALL